MHVHTNLAGYTPSWSSFSQSHAPFCLENLRGGRMDSIFLLGEGERAAFLQHMMQSLGCTHLCLWSYLPQPSNCMLYLDGVYREISNVTQPSSSSGSLANRLFHAYCESVTFVDQNRRIPGFAFKNNLPYMELSPNDFRRMASSEVQLQFYQEAGIKTMVFLGCATGEIEIGISTEAKVDVENELKSWFPVDFARQTVLPPTNRSQTPSPSSSSLRSLSADSSAQSPLLFNIPSTSFVPELPKRVIGEGLLQDVLRSSVPISAPIASSSHNQVNHTLSQIRNTQFPSIENEEAAMMKAILAVISSPSTSSTPQNFPPFSHKPSAFTNYRGALAPIGRNRIQKQNMFRRAVSFYRNLNESRIHEQQIQGSRPTTTQLHHMISERRRREKLNDSFQILRSLLPPGSKKDKATVLSKTTEYLSSLKSQVDELSRRNQMLESQKASSTEEIGLVESSLCSHERVNVEMEHVSSSSSTSEERLVELRVRLRGECRLLDMVTRVMESLRQERNLTLVSLQSNTSIIESVQVHGITLRFKIEDGATFDQSSFQEALKRALDHQL